MRADSVYFKGHLCFQKEWAGFDTIKPINVIIGRNNSGKSHLLDLVEALSQGELGGRGWQYRCRGVLDEESLRRRFDDHMSGGELGGEKDYWRDHGRYFVNTKITWEIDADGNVPNVDFPDDFTLESPFGARSTDARLSGIKGLVCEPTHEFNGKLFRRLLADRDIQTEFPNQNLTLGPDGGGASNIMRRFIVSSEFPRELIQHELRNGLNFIFGNDGQFSVIHVKHQDDEGSGGPQSQWEVYLGEEKKGLIPLSKSGSGLKTVLLVLLNLFGCS